MFVVISILMLIASVLMTLIVLVQNSKGGGLASNFSSSNQIMGVRQTADFLEKATWTMAIAMLVLSLAAAMAIPKYDITAGQADTELRKQIEQTAPVDFQAPPTAPDID
ncbi:MAG: preprotein translocase subunit SecG [Bacteroidales bacterium]|jgi:preprotein translocase subunit SecG|nr:preprotein translocase subunit SecG [Bacteroidales bacterium]MCK9448167.1 preprotein translocase subunit SecG [Bacteroidales bacterium]MDD3700953.1 preprotein translocase subunit SecG [Bacteroidales bacterium]MDY0370233.1 preprotein translocase subunit SecG [Bacteroidales bacterium]